MRVVTWNVNRFNGINKGDLEISERLVYAQKIVEKLKTIIETEDDIAVLQEVPFTERPGGNGWEGWNKFEGWKQLLEKDFEVHSWFSEEYKKQKKDRRPDFQYRAQSITVAITMKNSKKWQLRKFNEDKVIKFKITKGKHDYANRYIEMENGNISLLGIHVTADSDKNEKKQQDYKMQWDQIKSAASVKDSRKFTFIVGDFNTNDLKYKSNTNIQYLEEKGYIRLIANNIITFNQGSTSIDNIFINQNAGFDINNARVDVIDDCFMLHNDKRYSDHNICICEL